mgnify:CR=1 FL=1
MDYKYIEQLLSRYFQAETTLKEEQILKAFFAQDDAEMPEELLPYKSLFAAISQNDVLHADFDQRILDIIRQPTVTKARTISLAERFRPLLRAAAVVAIVLTFSTAINQSFRDDNVWTNEEQIAQYQDEMRKAALAATKDSTLLYTEGIYVKTDSIAKDSLYSTTGF